MSLPASLDDGSLEDVSLSYLYPHSWPPGTEVSHGTYGTDVAAPPRRTRAVIGNELRMPALWCELGTCIERFSHPDALGMRDVRARAETAGWRRDAFDRLTCPRCQQADPSFRATHQVVPWLPLHGQVSPQRPPEAVVPRSLLARRGARPGRR